MAISIDAANQIVEHLAKSGFIQLGRGAGISIRINDIGIENLKKSNHPDLDLVLANCVMDAPVDGDCPA